MDLSEEKFQELYFVVYICLLFIFAMLHNMNIYAQEKANLKKETLQLRYLREHSCFDINYFKGNPEDISLFTGFSDYQTMMLCYQIIKDSTKNLSYGVHERKVFNAQSTWKASKSNNNWYCCIYKLSASLNTMISSKLSNATCVHSFQTINSAMLHGRTLTVTLYYRYFCLNTK